MTIEPTRMYRTAGVLSFGKGLFARAPTLGTDTSYTHYFRLRSEQVVYSRLFAWEGAVALVTPDFDGFFVSQEFPTFAVDTSKAVPSYLGLVARWPTFHSSLASVTKGLGLRRQRVHPEQFLAMQIPLPDIDEQRRVAARVDSLLSPTRLLVDLLKKNDSTMFLAAVPALVDAVFGELAGTTARVGDLADIVTDTVHPGDDPGPAREFVGLQHIESHSGRRLGSDPIGDEKGRKFRFCPGDIVYAYLRPYLNKVWVADRHGLCSVDQYVLRPREGVDATLFGHALRSRTTLDQAIEMTHSLQLPRLRSGLLVSIRVPWRDDTAPSTLRSQLDHVSHAMLAAVDRRRQQIEVARSLTPSILNRAFAGLL